jgi:hypothetical protein
MHETADRMPTVEERLAKLEVDQGADTAIIAALIATHPNPAALRSQWTAMRQAADADVRSMYAGHPELMQWFMFRIAVWQGVLQGPGNAPEARH